MEASGPVVRKEQSKKRKRDETTPDPQPQRPRNKKIRIEESKVAIKPKNVVRGSLIKLPPEVLAKLKPPVNKPNFNDNDGQNESGPNQREKGKGKEKEKDTQTSDATQGAQNSSHKASNKSQKARKTHKVGTTKVPLKPKSLIRKLAPPRPWPNVPTSLSATVPSPGNNHICVTRRTPLANYLRRCHDLLAKQGFKEVHLTAMGAAIPHAVLLATSLPPILPFDSREVETIVTTGTTTVMDEVQPVYDDEEGKMETRDKSTIMIVIRIVEGKEDRVST